jgi:hypothetical protein
VFGAAVASGADGDTVRFAVAKHNLGAERIAGAAGRRAVHAHDLPDFRDPADGDIQSASHLLAVPMIQYRAVERFINADHLALLPPSGCTLKRTTQAAEMSPSTDKRHEELQDELQRSRGLCRTTRPKGGADGK